MTNKTPITFVAYKIKKIDYELLDGVISEENRGIHTDIECGLDEELETGQIVIDLSMVNDENIKVHTIVAGYFEINKDFESDKDKIQNYLAINGAAILFPYVRSIISMVSSLDSQGSIVMPTLNLVDLLKNEDSKKPICDEE